jgi:hypothetical protein
MLTRPMPCHAVFIVLFALLASCATPSEKGPFITVGSQPPNVGDAKITQLGVGNEAARAAGGACCHRAFLRGKAISTYGVRHGSTRSRCFSAARLCP